MFDNWFVLEGGIVPRSTMNRPLVEVELAFVLREPLAGPGVNVADVIRATDFVLPAIEIVDSRQLGRGPNTLIDSIADAASCGLVVLGGKPDEAHRHRRAPRRRHPVDQRRHRGERHGLEP